MLAERPGGFPVDKTNPDGQGFTDFEFTQRHQATNRYKTSESYYVIRTTYYVPGQTVPFS